MIIIPVPSHGAHIQVKSSILSIVLNGTFSYVEFDFQQVFKNWYQLHAARILSSLPSCGPDGADTKFK